MRPSLKEPRMSTTPYFLHETSLPVHDSSAKVFFVADTPQGHDLVAATEMTDQQKRAHRRHETTTIVATAVGTILLVASVVAGVWGAVSSGFSLTEFVTSGYPVLVGGICGAAGVVAFLVAFGSSTTAKRLDPDRRYFNLTDSDLTVTVGSFLRGDSRWNTLEGIAALPSIEGKNPLDFLRAAGERGMPEAGMRIAREHLEERKEQKVEDRRREREAARQQERQDMDDLLASLPERGTK